MANSPEIKPRSSSTSDYEVPPSQSAVPGGRNNQFESNSNSSIGYILGVFVLLVIAYFAYAYYAQNPANPTTANQNTTTVAPPMVPAAPSTPVPAAPSASVPTAPSAPVPATPATPPAKTTTP